MYEILHYQTAAGTAVYEEWARRLHDKTAEMKLAARIERLQLGNFGDVKPVGHGIYELRIDYGPGYRIYYAVVGRRIILLLCGGDKRRQSADIAAAVQYLMDYRERSAQS